MKNLLYLLIFGTIIMSSCSNDEIVVQNEREMVIEANTKLPVVNQEVGFKLINKRRIQENEVSNLRSMSYTSAYDRSIPIYRYLYYASTNIDHLYTTSNSSTLLHDNRNYSQENQDFNLMPFNLGNITQALYRYRSSTSNNHLLSSSSSSVSSFTNEELIGYIFKEQQVGTVPLLEYYSSLRNSYLYPSTRGEIENWLPYHDTDFKYSKTLGYVYSGRTLDSKKTATKFIIKNTNNSTYYPTSILLTVKVREVDAYWELTYSVDVPNKGGSVTLPIANTYIVVAADMALTSNIHSEVTNTFTDITNPEGYDDIKGIWGNIVMFLERSISGYDVTYNFHYDVVMGNGTYNIL